MSSVRSEEDAEFGRTILKVIVAFLVIVVLAGIALIVFSDFFATF